MSSEVAVGPRVMSRRQILVGGAGVVVAAGVGLSMAGAGEGLLNALPFVGSGSHHPLDRTPMAERIGERFATHDADGARVDLTLAAVQPLPASTQPNNHEGQFLARFAGPPDKPLPQNTYQFATRSFGDVDVFIVPDP